MLRHDGLNCKYRISQNACKSKFFSKSSSNLGASQRAEMIESRAKHFDELNSNKVSQFMDNMKLEVAWLPVRIDGKAAPGW
jgi:hypothetical protein